MAPTVPFTGHMMRGLSQGVKSETLDWVLHKDPEPGMAGGYGARLTSQRTASEARGYLAGRVNIGCILSGCPA